MDYYEICVLWERNLPRYTLKNVTIAKIVDGDIKLKLIFEVIPLLRRSGNRLADQSIYVTKVFAATSTQCREDRMRMETNFLFAGLSIVFLVYTSGLRTE